MGVYMCMYKIQCSVPYGKLFNTEKSIAEWMALPVEMQPLILSVLQPTV